MKLLVPVFLVTMVIMVTSADSFLKCYADCANGTYTHADGTVDPITDLIPCTKETFSDKCFRSTGCAVVKFIIDMTSQVDGEQITGIKCMLLQLNPSCNVMMVLLFRCLKLEVVHVNLFSVFDHIQHLFKIQYVFSPFLTHVIFI